MTPHTVWYLSITTYVYIIFLVKFVLNLFDLVVTAVMTLLSQRPELGDLALTVHNVYKCVQIFCPPLGVTQS